MLNRVAENLTGLTANEAYGKHYKEVFRLSNEREGYTIEDPIEKVLKTDTVQELGNHAVLTSKYGDRFCVEDSAAPIKNDKNITTGVVLVFRDVTEKKEQNKKIEYLSYHDYLTGLCNRIFFEKELYRLDTKRNLPLSIIVGDVNGLKIANDIFGHAAGDLLLKSATVKKVIKTLHINNPREEEHSKRISNICESIGKKMGLPEDEIQKLKKAGFLHDIGKIALDESLPDNSEVLNGDDEKKMNEHPVIGFRILNFFDETMDLAESVLAHHELWDGSGYPKGLKGEQIPKLARIISIAEYYDAMITRQDSNALKKEDIIRELKKQAGVKFDSAIVDVLIRILLEKE
jgi:PAS domain S-box-containing protein/putative nucleotidyltransferase with HDIG domain